MTGTVATRLDDETIQKIEQRAKEIGMNKAEFVKRAVLAALGDDEQARIVVPDELRPQAVKFLRDALRNPSHEQHALAFALFYAPEKLDMFSGGI